MDDVRYEPIGEELTIETAAVQAAISLDVAATIAERQSDAATVVQVAEQWMKLADFMAALRDNDDKRPDEKKNNLPMGFQVAATEISEDVVSNVIIDDGNIELEEIEEEDVRSDDCDD